jgi:hypothetical protein
MPFGICAALFAFVVGTIIVPAGSQLVGRLIEMFGTAMQRHGEALHDAYAGYVARWRMR